jgi:hypothetical protein
MCIRLQSLHRARLPFHHFLAQHGPAPLVIYRLHSLTFVPSQFDGADMCRSCSQHWTQISKHPAILSILAPDSCDPCCVSSSSAFPHSPQRVVTDIMVGDWHMVTLCARRPFLVLVNLFHCSLAPVSEHPCISKSFIQILRLQFCRAGLPAAVAALAFLATCWPYDQDAPTYPNGDLTLLFNATYATRILNEHSYISIHAILLIVKFHTCHPYMPFCAPLGCHMAMKAWKVGHDVGCPRTPRTQLSYGPATGCFGSDDRDISWLYQFTMGASLHNNLDFNWLHAPAAQPDGTVPAEWIWENQRTCNIRAT